MSPAALLLSSSVVERSEIPMQSGRRNICPTALLLAPPVASHSSSFCNSIQQYRSFSLLMDTNNSGNILKEWCVVSLSPDSYRDGEG